MKLYERVHDNRPTNIVSINEEQFGFVNGKCATGAVFCDKTAARKIQRRIAIFALCVRCSGKKHPTEYRGNNCFGA